MIICGQQYRDTDKETMEFELSRRMRQQFIIRYECNCTRETMNFVLSLSSARFGDCQKDIARNKITLQQALDILSVAVSFSVVSAVYAEILKSRWEIASN